MSAAGSDEDEIMQDAAIDTDVLIVGAGPVSPGQHKLVVRVPNVPDKMRRLEIEVGYRTSVKFLRR
jgi:hypothetical protein